MSPWSLQKGPWCLIFKDLGQKVEFPTQEQWIVDETDNNEAKIPNHPTHNRSTLLYNPIIII